MTRFNDIAGDAESLPPLGPGEALELAAYVSELAKAGLPLAPGLRAAAAEADTGRLGGAFSKLASELEAGRPLDSALESVASSLPPHIRALMVAGARSGQLHATLDGLLAHERSIDDMTQRLWQASLYPATLLVFFAGWVLFISWWIVPSMQIDTSLADDLFSGFNSRPWFEHGRPLIEFAQVAPPLLLASLGTLVVIVIFARVFSGPGLVSRMASAVPLYGRALWYRSLTEFSGLLPIFLARELPLGEALELTSLAARDPAIRADCATMAAEVNSGRDLSACLAQRSTFPATLVALVQWGQANALVDTLQCARQMYADRFDMQVRLARMIVPPIVFLLIGGSALFVAYGVFGSLMSLVKLLVDLS